MGERQLRTSGLSRRRCSLAYFLYASEIPYLHSGGASRSIQTLFKTLVAQGHKCVTVSPATKESHITVDGVLCIRTVHQKQWVENIVSADHPDLVLTQLGGDYWVINKATRFLVPVILRIPSFGEYMCGASGKFIYCTRFCLHKESCPHRIDRSNIIKKASAIITSSKYAVRAVKQFYGRNALVVYPPVDPEAHLVEKTGDRITLVRGHVAKGVKTFYNVARGCPEYKYLIVDNRTPRPVWAKGIDIEMMPATNDMKIVWSQTRVLLVPSRGSESFGRVCVEANLNGIPVVAARHTGLVESAGLDATIPMTPGDPSAWREEVRRLMTDHAYYDERSRKAKEHADQFSIAAEVKKFVGLADALINQPIAARGPYIISTNAMPQVVFFGPWIGEFGWEIATWQAWCRREAKKYDKVYMCSYPDMEALYKDFATFIPHRHTKRHVVWAPREGVKYSGIRYRIPHDVTHHVLPIKDYRAGGDFIRFGDNPNSQYSCLIHAGLHEEADKQIKNYPKESWTQIVAGLPPDTACIGTKRDLHIEGTIDLRGIPLTDLMNYMTGCKVLAGGSSGPLCLGLLCGTRSVIWGPLGNTFGETLEKRLTTTWNPLNADVTYISQGGWRPGPAVVLDQIQAVLSES